MVDLIVPDDTAGDAFARAVLRVETRNPCTDLTIVAQVNGMRLQACDYEGRELFAPLADNAGYASRDTLKFYAVPLDLLVLGNNRVAIDNSDKTTKPCTFVTMELGLFHGDSCKSLS